MYKIVTTLLTRALFGVNSLSLFPFLYVGYVVQGNLLISLKNDPCLLKYEGHE